MKDLDEAAYILSIKIYWDRSRRLISFSISTYLDKILKKFNMDRSKKGFLPVLQGVKLSRLKSRPRQKIEREWKVVPYASVIGSIKYVMLWTRPIVYLDLSLTKEYNFDLRIDHWTAVKNILKYLKRTKDMFLVYGGDEELVAKG